MSCQVSDIDFAWQLAEDGDGTVITLWVMIPRAEGAGVVEKCLLRRSLVLWLGGG